METHLKKLQILLIDDDPNSAELLNFKMGELNIPYQLSVFETGREALADLRSKDSAGLPDIIVLDIYLPDVNGLDILKEIKSNASLRSIPVLVMTVSGLSEDVKTAYRNGGAVFLSKFEDSKSLRDALRQLRISGMLAS